MRKEGIKDKSKVCDLQKPLRSWGIHVDILTL